MENKAVDLELLTVLNRIVTSLEDPDNQYMVSANYYDHQTLDRFGERCGAARRYIAQIWISQESASNVMLTDEGLVCEVSLNPDNLSEKSTILLPFDQIWSIQQLTHSPFDQPVLYHRSDKLNLKHPYSPDT